MSTSATFPVAPISSPLAGGSGTTTGQPQEVAITLAPTVTNPDVGDLWLNELGDIVLLVDLAECVRQRLTVRMSFFKGEWFLDAEEGTPYFEYLIVKSPQDRLIRLVFTQVIEGCPGVASVTRLTYGISRDRRLSVQFEARLEDGSVFRSTDYPPFVVTL